jgi:hypothetical protein
MAKHMNFDFTDGECQHFPIIVRIDKDIDFDTMVNIDNAVRKKIDEYIENEEYWDSDEILLTEVLEEKAKEFDFNYEIINIDYTAYSND